ncbi:MAG TPA: hypothetical protein VMM16_06345 [Verrucomicrobiae bacterium]|nr:hypothetical protein [Verrucomicrobiae bacterium]
MIQLIFFLSIGALLFASLFLLARRSARPEGGSGALVEARQALSTLQAGLLPADMVKRIFTQEDWEYVRSVAPQKVRELFMEERKRVALLWVDQVRAQIRSLRRFHRGSARFYARLNPRLEMELAMSFAALMGACSLLRALVYVGGPYAAPRMVGAMANAAARACKVSEESLSFLNAAQLGMLNSRPAGRAAL